MPDEHDQHAAEPTEGVGPGDQARAVMTARDVSMSSPSAPAPPAPWEVAQQQQRTILRAVRMSFFVLLFTVGLLTFLQDLDAPESSQEDFVIISRQARWGITLLIPIVLALVAVTTDVLTPKKKISTISGVVLGILGGLLATIAIGAVLDLMMQAWINQPRVMAELSPVLMTFKVMLGVTLCYLGVSTVIQTQDDFRLVIPYVEFSRQIRGPKPLILDTSALIDARIAEVASTGMLQTPLVIPRFVVLELQTLADSSDRLKRLKGRRGLDVIGRLQRGVLDVTIDETPMPGKAVDQMIVELARVTPAILVTTDSALERVARIQGVGVLNLHETAAAFRPSLAPGEQVVLRLVKPGEQPGQAVGYLDDGTMVVAEHAAGLIGHDVALTVTSTMQTSAGRLVFAKPMHEGDGSTARERTMNLPDRRESWSGSGRSESPVPGGRVGMERDDRNAVSLAKTASGVEGESSDSPNTAERSPGAGRAAQEATTHINSGSVTEPDTTHDDSASNHSGSRVGQAGDGGGSGGAAGPAASGPPADRSPSGDGSGPYPPRRSDRRPPTPRNPRR